MLSISYDLRTFSAAGERLASGVLEGTRAAVIDVAGDAAVAMALATPPGSRGVQGESALARGRSAIARDVLRVAVPISSPKPPVETVATVMRRYRRNGRTPRLSRRIVVSRADFESYLARTAPMVGYTAGGFEAAAHALGKSLPGWIEDRNGPGSVSIRTGGDLVEVEFSNDVPWFSSLTGMPAMMRSATEAQREPLETALVEVLRRSAAASGF
jgi:hypothetical protein